MAIQEIGLVVLVIVFILFLFCIPILMEGAFKSSAPFSVEYAYDITYEDEILRFKTRDKYGVCEWAFRGSCTVWYYMNGKRCGTLFEEKLSEIWEKVQWERKYGKDKRNI